MGTKIRCFWLEPTQQCERSLRRFVWSNVAKCSGKYGYHTASAKIGVINSTQGQGVYPESAGIARDDPRWPKACSCGYVFLESDEWQVNDELLHKRSDTGGLTTLSDAPYGAMWDATWMPWKGPDGMCLTVKTPGGDWPVDMPASNSKQPWKRSGKPPLVTASPSIGIGGTNGKWKYHGWLRNGTLEEC